MRRGLRRSLAALVAASVSACAGVELPKLEPGASTGQPAIAPGSQAASSEPAIRPFRETDAAKATATATVETIIALKKDTIVLYREQNGFEGERVLAASFALPVSARRATGNPMRLEVLTATGMRWVDRADVVVSSQTK